MIILFRYQIFTNNFLIYTWKCRIGFRYVNINKLKIIKLYILANTIFNSYSLPLFCYENIPVHGKEHFDFNMYINFYDAYHHWFYVQWYTRLKRLTLKEISSLKHRKSIHLVIVYSIFYTIRKLSTRVID